MALALRFGEASLILSRWWHPIVTITFRLLFCFPATSNASLAERRFPVLRSLGFNHQFKKLLKAIGDCGPVTSLIERADHMNSTVARHEKEFRVSKKASENNITRPYVHRSFVVE